MSTRSTSSLLNRPIPSLVNGVSQQPPALRLSSQCESQLNGYSTLVEGLKKRPPSELLAKINADTDEDSFVHFINRDSTERYVVVIKDASLKIYNLAGTEMAYVWEDRTETSLNAVTATGAGTAFQIYIPESVTQATFVTSGITTATVLWEQSSTGAFGGEETTVRTDTTDTSGLVTVTGGFFYRARVSAYTSGTITATMTWDDSEYLHVTGIPRESFSLVTIADYTLIVNKEKVTAKGTAVADGTDKGAVQDFSSLPGSPINNDVYEIAGDPNNGFDSYYVRWNSTSAVWRECPKVGVEIEFDAATMPHTLVRSAVNTFTFSKSSWANRLVGDDTTNPFPSFLGSTLSDIFFHRNRLGVLSGESIVLTTNPASDFNFFRGSATVLVDSDPIDAPASSTKVATLYHAIPFDKSLLLMSDQTQFLLSGTTVLTPTTATLDVTTEFEASVKCPPVAAGPNLYFAVPKGNFTGIREYFVEDEVTTNDAADVTAHVPTFLDQDIFSLITSSNEDILMALSSNTRNKIWVYKYYWQGNEKVQSSWSDWQFDATDVILGAEIIETDLYLVIKRADGTYLDKVPLQTNNPDAGMGFQVLLDRKELLTGVYDGGNDWTTFTASAPHNNNLDIVKGAGWGTGEIGEKLVVLSYPTATTVRVSGDYSAFQCWVGVPYTFLYKFSEFFLKDAQGNAIREGRLMLRYLVLNFVQTGFYKVTVTPRYRDPYTSTFDRDPSSSTFTGIILGGGSALLGVVQIIDGSEQIPLFGDSELIEVEIENDTHLPSNFQSAEWTALYHGKANR